MIQHGNFPSFILIKNKMKDEMILFAVKVVWGNMWI